MWTSLDGWTDGHTNRQTDRRTQAMTIPRRTGPQWYDRECRLLRSEAVTAGERVLTDDDRERSLHKCKKYRACKQRKEREFKTKCLTQIETAYANNRSDMWNVLNLIGGKGPNHKVIEPDGSEFIRYFRSLNSPPEADYFDMSYEQEAISFLEKYDCWDQKENYSSIELSVINDSFTKDEIERSIDSLKTNKAPGVDSIPSEIIKHSKNIISGTITDAFNYIIEKRQFPEIWSEGLRLPIFKAGERHMAENYRGITILPIMEKIFEVSVYRRLSFVNEAFGKIDENNGGFLEGRRTADNIFVLHGLIQRQLLMGKSLFVCFVDFSKAFDLVNRNILFYKIMKSGWYGKVIDTLRNMYKKTSYRVKSKGWVSFLINDVMGVNQGGVASGLLFRKYMADLGNYLKSECGVCIGDIIIMHLLWADDLILISDTALGLQKQLDGLLKFCSKNLTTVNEIKTKCMTFGNIKTVELFFNHKLIEQVEQYKCLGNFIRSTVRFNEDIFSYNYPYLCQQSRKAIFGIQRRKRNVGVLPPKITMYMFNALVKPILVYGSE